MKIEVHHGRKWIPTFLGLAPALAIVAGLVGCGGGKAQVLTPPLTPPLLLSVTISPKNVSNLPAAGTQNFTATVSGTNNKTVNWKVEEGASCGSVTSTGTYFAPNSPGLVCHLVVTSQADSTKTDKASITISPVSMYVLPYQVALGIGQTQTFTATVQGTPNTAVTWSVMEGLSGGTITSLGVYTAPQSLGTFHVIATSQADSRFAGSAVVDVVPLAVSVSPPADTLGPLGTRMFAANVVGPNQAVTWSIQEDPNGGLITSGGDYTAPQTLGTFHVVATSQADSTASGLGVVTVVASGFTLGNPMDQTRAEHTATLLPDGRVLVAGGTSSTGCSLSSIEIFDPMSNSFSDAGAMSVGRAGHTAIALSDGRVLIAGGSTCAAGTLASAELYDPTSGTLASTGNMTTPRLFQTATLLQNGRILIVGGEYPEGSEFSMGSAELYDPSTGTFTATGSMQKARVGHSATLLQNGKVLITGGYTPACSGCITVPDNTAELYDPGTGTFAPTGIMPGPIAWHTATLLPSGLVLVAGGDFCGANGAGGGSECSEEDGTNQALLYDSATGTFNATGAMAYARIGHSATLLPGGNVLIAGGIGADPVTQDDVTTFSAELYDPATGLFRRTGSMAFGRRGHTATPISNARVLAVGGSDNFGNALSSVEIYK